MSRNLEVGRHVLLRCGDTAVIDGINISEGRMWGRLVRYGHKLEWNLEGRRKPVGGEDPVDLVIDENMNQA